MCRSLLKPIYPDGKLKLYGRFNLGVCTVNLPYAAYVAKKEGKDFFEVLDSYLALCRKAQLTRVKRIANSTTDCAPILWQDGAFMRAPAGEKLEKYIYGGYASISLGYAGVYEATMIMTGESQSGPNGGPFAEKVMKIEESSIDNINEYIFFAFRPAPAAFRHTLRHKQRPARSKRKYM